MIEMAVGTAALDEELRRRRVKRRVIGIDDGPVVIGRYVVVAAIDEGAMGVVYEAHDPELERSVALKVLRPRDAELGARLLREARSVARVSHANVVGIHEVGSSPWGVYLAMELVRGPTLRQWCAQRRSRAEIVEMFAQAALGLHAAHRAGVVHRDVKPDNVRIAEDRHDATSLGTARVLDFGLACTSGSIELPADADAALGELQLTGTGELIGTPAYMSPEQFEGGAITAASDQFSLCVALFEALTGAMPFAGATATQRRDEVIAGRLRRKSLDALPPSLAGPLAKGLARDPSQRHADMLALVTALRGAPPRRTRRSLAIVSAVFALGGLAALAAGSAPAPELPPPPPPPIVEPPTIAVIAVPPRDECAARPSDEPAILDRRVTQLRTLMEATSADAPELGEVRRRTATALLGLRRDREACDLLELTLRDGDPQVAADARCSYLYFCALPPEPRCGRIATETRALCRAGLDACCGEVVVPLQRRCHDETLAADERAAACREAAQILTEANEK